MDRYPDIALPEWIDEEVIASSPQDKQWMRNARYNMGIFRNEQERQMVRTKRSIMRVYKSVFWILLPIGPLATVIFFPAPSYLILPEIMLVSVLWVMFLAWIVNLFDTEIVPFSSPVTHELLIRTGTDIKRAGLLSAFSPPSEEPAYIMIAGKDPALALAGLRMQVEARVRKVAAKHGVYSENLADIFSELRRKNLLNHDQYRALSNLRRIMNWAVHGDPVDGRAEAFVRNVGPGLVAWLDELLKR